MHGAVSTLLSAQPLLQIRSAKMKGLQAAVSNGNSQAERVRAWVRVGCGQRCSMDIRDGVYFGTRHVR